MADGEIKIITSVDSGGAEKGLNALKLSVGAAVTALAGYAVKVGMDFEAGMSKVAAISGATGDELTQLTEKAKEMGIKTKYSATEASEAMSYMAMAGWKTTDMLNGIEGVMNLAAASGEDLAMVSDIVTDALTAFGLSAEDSGHFADVLAAASSNANTNVGLMGETFKYVAPVAGSLGFSVEDTATAIGLMANAGLKGSQAGTALRSIMTRLVKPTKDSAQAIKALGLQITNSDGSMKSFDSIIMQLRDSFGKLSESQQAQYAAAIAGQEGMSGLLAIVNASEADFYKLSSAIKSADGTAEKMAETMNDNLKGKLTLLGSSMEGLGLSIFEGLQEPLKDAVSYAIDAVNDLAKAFSSGALKGSIKAIGEMLGQLVKVIANIAKTVLPVFIKALGLVGNNLKIIIPLVTGYVAAVKGMSIIQNAAKWILAKVAALTASSAATAASTAATAGNTVATAANAAAETTATTATLAFTAAKQTLSTAMTFLTSPLGLVTVGIGLLTGAVIAACTSTNEATEAYGKQKQALEEDAQAAQEAAEKFDELSKAQEENIDKSVSQYDNAASLWEELKGLADESGNIAEKDTERAKILAELLNPTLGETIKLNKNGTASLTDQKKAIDDLLKKKREQAILAAKEPAYNEAIAKSYTLLTKQKQLDASITARKNTIDQLSAQAQQALAEGNNSLAFSLGTKVAKESEYLKQEEELYNQNKDTLKGYYEEIADYEGTLAAIKQGNFDAYTGMQMQLVDTTNMTTEQLIEAYDDRIGMEQEKYDTMVEQSQEAGSKITATQLAEQQQRVINEKNAMIASLTESALGGQKLTEQAKQNARDVLNSYATLPPSQRNTALQSMIGMIDGIEEKYPALKNASQMSADEIISILETELGLEKTKPFGKNAADGAKDGLTENNPKEDAKTVGHDIGDGLKTGIDEKTQPIASAAAGLVVGAIAAARRAAESHSPSRKFAAIGRDLDAGLVVGIDEDSVDVSDAMEDTVQGMVEKMRATVQAEVSARSILPSVQLSPQSGATAAGVIRQMLENNSTINLLLDGEVVTRAVEKHQKINRLVYGR